ncbi:DUF3800 domain-containing protein [Enterococcus sp. AZ103]|uniref:DUF3800 domain-containing protein n=1 Tax=Enterococcus sp. AZ103 TaxID=2774628 RepID=UPI003F26D7A3
MRLFIDESGIITKSKNKKRRFFIIAFLETDDPYNVIRQFRRAKKEYIGMNKCCTFNIKDEIKGSEMPYGMKKMIFKRLSDKTDAKFHFKIIDNFHISNNLVSNTSLAFNYFLYLSIQEIKKISSTKKTKELFLQIDDRNTAIGSLNSLQEYLSIKFLFETEEFDEIKTSYKDSKSKDLIQVIDLFSNTIFRIAKNHAIGLNNDKKNTELLSCCNVGCAHYFPWNSCKIEICKY